jgi:hypothetical protein
MIGMLAFRARLPATCGIVLFRLSLPSPSIAARRIVQALECRDDWAGHFSTVDDSCIRVLPLPA